MAFIYVIIPRLLPRTRLFPSTTPFPSDRGARPLPIGRSAGLDVEDPRSDRKSTRLNSSHMSISYAVFCLNKKKNKNSITSTGGHIEYEAKPMSVTAVL